MTFLYRLLALFDYLLVFVVFVKTNLVSKVLHEDFHPITLTRDCYRDEKCLSLCHGYLPEQDKHPTLSSGEASVFDGDYSLYDLHPASC